VAAIPAGRDLRSLNPLPSPGVATGLGHGAECGSDGLLTPQTPQNGRLCAALRRGAGGAPSKNRASRSAQAAGITDYVRPFHDARHASLTKGAAAGETPIALMARAGHRWMSTTKQYLHLAGVVFARRPTSSSDGCWVQLCTHLSRPRRRSHST
jgi:hypothetical protein